MTSLKPFCIGLFLMLSLSITGFAQQKRQLIDVFYEALSLKDTDSLKNSSIKFYELILTNYENEIIDPAAIIKKYPDARRYLVNDSVFNIKAYVEINGLIEDLSIADPRITIQNFHFSNKININLKIYSDLEDEVYNASKLIFKNIKADNAFVIWFNNFNTLFTDVTLRNLWIGNESVVSPLIEITKSKIDLLQFWAIQPAEISINNNRLGVVEISEVATKSFEISNNTFKLPVAGFPRGNATRLAFIRNEDRKVEETSVDYLLAIASDDKTINTLYIHDNVFLDESKSLPIIFAQNSKKMVVTNNTFETPFIISSIVTASFELDHNSFSTVSMGVSMPSTPQNLVNVTWKDLKGKLVWQSDVYATPYLGFTDKELQDDKHFYNLIGSYSRLLEVYKNYGNQDDANDVFLDMKALHLKRYEYLYRTEGGTTNFFQLYLNKLLKVYTRHGTDPAQAMTASLWIIIFFSFIYFFFPSDWDVTSKHKLMTDFKSFREKNDKGYFKPFLVLLIGLFLSFFNAITLSVNSFVTLGFGTIPTRGLAKYICIFQGFLGWFLLSIFIVALINQILI
jgi:hypothetical protein